MQIFLGAPFTQDINKETKVMHDHKTELLKNIMNYLEEKGHIVKNAHSREKFGVELMTPNVCTKADFDEVNNCDIFMAIVGNPPSGGVHVELGWASALNKKIILLLHEGQEYSPLITGLTSVSNTKIVKFKDESEFPKILDKLL
ncbi:MAG: nucleoside 2-deoxyribosyltransferase [archaeon]|jgi:nucleoside 2-deoxyribosyltransferase